jgi:hypothetical protein
MTAGIDMAAARVIALYLPQYHPIPENDEWWGKGFTEWTNVAKARPLFWGHQQPRLPADLGFYDLRVPEVREAQAQLARDCGIEGFCYWHYWFGNGRRILERPFTEVLERGAPDFPFCLAWANHSWTTIWRGDDRRTLIEQTYPGPDDERAHFDAVLPAFRDPRYICVDGKPVFGVFKPWEVPDADGFVSHWRRLAKDNGFPGLYFVAISNEFLDQRLRPYDAITSNPPFDFLAARKLRARIRMRIQSRNLQRDYFGAGLNKFLARFRLPARYDYKDVVEAALTTMPNNPRYLPCVLPNWDNTPRSNVRGVVLENATPDLFKRYLMTAVQRVSDRPAAQRIIFLKSWNEWAEGNFVEPGNEFGSGFLDAIRTTLFVDKH